MSNFTVYPVPGKDVIRRPHVRLVFNENTHDEHVEVMFREDIETLIYDLSRAIDYVEDK